MNLSLYIHIPFCAKKCRYCDFYSVPYDETLAGNYLRALAKEINLDREDPVIRGATIDTVFIGGGTPTILCVSLLNALCAMIRNSFNLSPTLEWTVECNPDSFTHEKATALLGSGVTRLSFGMQSMDKRELSLLGRIHSAGRNRELLCDPVLAQCTSISVDLMYGLPGQVSDSLARSLDTVFASPHVHHISAYELTIAQGTPFGRHQSILPLPGDEGMEKQTLDLWKKLDNAGFKQYEISNFAREGHRCRHNEAYWDHSPYLGLGCAAHSYVGGVRRGNVKDIHRYLAMIDDEELPLEFVETIDQKKLAFEMVFLGLRRTRGIDEDIFKARCGVCFDEYVNTEKRALFIEQELLVLEKPFWKPTKKGILLADAMAREMT